MAIPLKAVPLLTFGGWRALCYRRDKPRGGGAGRWRARRLPPEALDPVPERASRPPDGRKAGLAGRWPLAAAGG
ncbi:MAG: hypothetical protein KGI40_12740, partial [Xanthomonadaceae bacterium]|nr:hypothetical protein [Xanthomonadaceae bacterium]